MSMSKFILWLAAIGFFAAVGYAQDQIPNPLTPATTVDQILDDLKWRGDTLQSFTADVQLTHLDMSTADSSTDVGTVVFQKLPSGDSRIRVNFTAEIDGEQKIDRHHEYTLANGILVDRDYQKKIESDQHVVKPGQKINLFKLGEGPFPLPIGQSRDDVKEEFNVTRVAPARDDPPNTVHLQLVPRPGSEFADHYQQIDVWADRADAMPVRITTLDKSGAISQTTDLSNIHLDAPVGDSDFALPPVPGWTVNPGADQQ